MLVPGSISSAVLLAISLCVVSSATERSAKPTQGVRQV